MPPVMNRRRRRFLAEAATTAVVALAVMAAAVAVTDAFAFSFRHQQAPAAARPPRAGSACGRELHPHRPSRLLPSTRQSLHLTLSSPSPMMESSSSDRLSVEDALLSRYACTRYQRYDGGDGGNTTTTTSAAADADTTAAPVVGPSDPAVVQAAFECLDVARRAPSGFNVQPYKLLLVRSPSEKQALASCCIGRNADRVRDSDCTVVFLADRQALRTLPNYRKMLHDGKYHRRQNQQQQQLDDDENSGDPQQSNDTAAATPARRRGLLFRWRQGWPMIKLQLLVAMFSSGLPLPGLVATPLGFVMRLAMRVVSWVCRGRLVVPTLSNAETWSVKNTSLVAMAYLLACTSRGLATTPMEGFLSWRIRQELRIPRRYTIPLIVATGRPYRPRQPQEEEDSVVESISSSTTTEGRVATSASSAAAASAADTENDETGVVAHKNNNNDRDDAGMVHGNTRDTATPRYPTDFVIYGDVFGRTLDVDMS